MFLLGSCKCPPIPDDVTSPSSSHLERLRRTS
jgi:hypothetical protein